MAMRRWILGTACGLTALTATTATDWPQWRGPTRDNKLADFKVPATWPKELKKGWTAEVGTGVSSPVLAGDKLYIFSRAGGDEVITCLNADTGKEIWKDKTPADPVPGSGGQVSGARSTPAVGEGMVVTFGADGTISCYDATSGNRAWRKDKTGRLMFSTSCSPLIVDGTVVLFVGGTAGGLTAFDLKTGDEKWKWTGEAASYGSPILATIAGTKQIVILSARSVVGVADGKKLWGVPYASRYNSGTPVVQGDTVYVSGPGAGTVEIKVEKSGDTFTATKGWSKNTASTNYNTPLLKDGMLYELTLAGGAAGGGGGRGGGGGGGRGGGGRGGAGGGLGVPGAQASALVCLDAKTGDTKWTSDAIAGDCGGVFDAGSHLIALSNKSELLVFKPAGSKYEEVAKYKVADTPTWALPILTGNRIFVKDANSVILWTVE